MICSKNLWDYLSTFIENNCIGQFIPFKILIKKYPNYVNKFENLRIVLEQNVFVSSLQMYYIFIKYENYLAINILFIDNTLGSTFSFIKILVCMTPNLKTTSFVVLS